jgi:hypothetical protein
MSGDWLLGIAKFIAAALIGALAVVIYEQTNPESPTDLPVNATWGSATAPMGTDPNAPLVALSHQLDVTVELTHQLEAQLEDLNLRLNELEQAQQQLLISHHDQAEDEAETLVISVQAPTAQEEKPPKKTGTLTLEALVEAGIDPAQADYILQRQGELDMQRLELRDRAIRDGTLGTKKYVQALRELNRNSPKLRNEVGEEVYDRYLYAMGQNNRVVVTSVIPGSAADQAGIREGDMILSYGDSRVYNWPEIRRATSEGYRGEYVTLKVQREQQILSMLVPRGPLGVRMKSSSKPPLDNPSY